MELPVLKAMVEEFQCPGCTCGNNTRCGSFIPEDTGTGSQCASHSAGTFMFPAGKVLQLGLPKGFNQVRKLRLAPDQTNHTNVRLHDTPATYRPDRLNVAVWAMEADGHLFVRTYSPRVDATFVDVIKGGTLALVPGAIDVGAFYSEID